MTIQPTTAYGFNLRNHGAPRTPGIHLSGILRRMAETNKLWEFRSDEPPLNTLIAETHSAGEWGSLVRISLGYAWEPWYMSHFPSIIPQPGEMTLDGIIGTPDGIEPLPTGSMLLHEVKVSWSSSNKPLDEGVKLYWLWECMGYLAMMSALFHEPCCTVILHPLYVNGDYKRDGPNTGPKCIPIQVTFSSEEILTNWQLVLANKDFAIPEEGQ